MTKKLLFVLLFYGPALLAQDNLTLWYDLPARNWNEALPIGNGRLGAMVFGNVQNELLQLNESSLWSGGPVNTNPNPLAPTYLQPIRKALEEENYELADELAKKLHGLFTESYEPLGDLHLKQNIDGNPSDYYRSLDLASATTTTRFTVNGITYAREMFASAPDQVIVIRLTASRPKALNFTIGASSPLYYSSEVIGENEIALNGKAPSHTDPSYMQTMEQPVVYNDPTGCRGMRFELRIKLKNIDGKVGTNDSGLEVSDATEVVIYLSAATSFNGFDKCPDKDGKDEKKIAQEYLSNAWSKSYADIKARHIADYKRYFDRVSLSINGNPKKDSPTNQRLDQYSKGNIDVGLETLYFQFGRYLLISSSRSPGIPTSRVYGTIMYGHHGAVTIPPTSTPR
jgi:alpha-L-fucosidase 2